ncbi:dCTP deaminase [Methylopila capsulata]|uniref:dCTP deaminase n=1 Tax=Methylopila capsulata TaxID=61654 RepID=A0A9W6MSM5_9HYPH|nr:deoxycytidine triphosphate deaminase [Methylopila capsulata]MBM7852264.1 dCTP deaminase [Methylopila capsulata]GLK56473.1 hypothetical protein GCM10008170_24920 [Methylopila capsulata]
MAFWSDKTWNDLDVTTSPVRPFKKKRIDDSNYLLSIGEEIYVSSPDSKNNVKKLSDNESFSIDPGQFAFLLTEEEIIIPFDKIGFISIRASVKFNGLVNISGFHVDPGYKGKLIFAVFNAGPIRIHLRRGEDIFPLWIADLDRPSTRTEYKKGHYNIPSKLINQISGDFTTAYQLSEQIKSARKDIDELKSFNFYSKIIIGLLLLVLSPYIKSTIDKTLRTPEAAQVQTKDGAN